MATDVILPVLGMSQDTGKVVQWLKAEGEQVTKGQPIVEVETDKATVELESPADGILTNLAATAGADIPVGQVIAKILTPHELAQTQEKLSTPSPAPLTHQPASVSTIPPSRLASRIADEHHVDLSQITPTGRRIQKDDVLAYLQNQQSPSASVNEARRITASPKARRLAAEQGLSLTTLQGSGPAGAVLAVDVLTAVKRPDADVPVAQTTSLDAVPSIDAEPLSSTDSHDLALSTTWRLMAERTTQSWTTVPHFFLTHEVRARRLISWREEVIKQSTLKITYTDLLVKVVAAALQAHPRVNSTWSDGKLTLKPEIHLGLAVAIEEGLVVPVIHHADTLSLSEIARQRVELVAKAQSGKLRPLDISEGTFTISNLGMYNVDAFQAIINQPQAAILAVGRIAERVVPVHGVPAVEPMMLLTLSCDHRAVDGARGARFLDTVATFLEEPLRLLT